MGPELVEVFRHDPMHRLLLRLGKRSTCVQGFDEALNPFGALGGTRGGGWLSGLVVGGRGTTRRGQEQ
jgi:hypothetical protein